MALQALFQIDLTREEPFRALSAALGTAEERVEDKSLEFARLLVGGVVQEKKRLDRLIRSLSHSWRLGRMGRIDRNILRLGLYELMSLPDIPAAASINEAVELAKKYSSEEAARFINGLLDRAAKDLGKK